VTHPGRGGTVPTLYTGLTASSTSEG
jgi:hypothetical protein